MTHLEILQGGPGGPNTNVGSDRAQLSKKAHAAREAMG